MDLRTCINWLNRDQIQTLLESNGMAVYDSESMEDLKDTLQECVKSGDIDKDEIRSLVE